MVQSLTDMNKGMQLLIKNVSSTIDGFQSMGRAAASAINSSEITKAATSMLSLSRYSSLTAEHWSKNSQMANTLGKTNDIQNRFSENLKKGTSEAQKLGAEFKALAKSGVDAYKKISKWTQDMLAQTNEQMKAERRLQASFSAAGFSQDQIAAMQQRAADMQESTIYSENALMTGAMSISGNADIAKMLMEPLADFAAGMSGGGAVSPEQMAAYGSQLRAALDGSYEGLESAGFQLTDVQKQILEFGDEMQRALVVNQLISESWGGFAQELANAPDGKIIQIAEAFNRVKAEVGAGLYPHVMELFGVIEAHMPTISGFMMEIGNLVGRAISLFAQYADGIGDMAAKILQNWSWIEPMILGVIGVIALYKGMVLATKTAEFIANSVKLAGAVASAIRTGALATETTGLAAATQAQWGLNAAILANPVFLIVGGIILLIAALSGIVAAINKMTGQSITIIGLICGVVATALAFVGNLVIGVINGVIQYLWTSFAEPVINIVEFIVNATTGGFGSMKDMAINFLGQIISQFISLGKVASKVLDTIFGTDTTGYLNSLQDTVLGWGKTEEAITLNRNAPTIDYRFSYGNAWSKGAELGSNAKRDYSGLKGNTAALRENSSRSSWKNAGDYSALQSKGMKRDTSDGFDFGNGYNGGAFGGIASDASAIAKNTSEVTEDLSYLRDLAEQEVINRFTTAEVRVEMINHNNISGKMDKDSFLHGIVEDLSEAISISAEGVAI